MFHCIINFIWPPHCAGCRELLPLNTIRLICGNCLKIIKQQGPSFENLAGNCKVICSARYESVCKNVIVEFKFHASRTIAKSLAQIMTDDLVKYSGTFTPDLIVPVPLHPKRKQERGFNQSELISKWISKILKIPCENSFLKRTRNTPSQRALGKGERVKNVTGAFKSRNAAGKNILLVDDVLTTGATMFECAKTLKKAGAKKVFAVAFAKA